ncbi:MAG: caspase family protein [Cyclobacteriaceae bacterium]|nr:caspase family protein [Cyclobacteriaceae bacterium]MCB0499182.1 caspase family protein [Cyclobacteriaceae bacterium]MCB9237978.1 caspase family protein [Flammeovirgaceae bacterium]MCO5271872.1 caspase family protein [Cyclobacteriaceae bacterium]MCW5901698.1 caspase family protein [Cyclobacteriaceae bacterium]
MKKAMVFFVIALGLGRLQAQEVDLLRLGYDRPSIQSGQVGMAVSPDGRFIAFVYEDKTIKVFDASIGRFTKRFKASFDGFFDVQLATGQRLALVGPKSVRVIDLVTEKEIKQFPLEAEATKTSFLGAHNLLAVGQKEGYVQVFDLVANEQTFATQYKKHHVSALAFHPSGKKLIVGVMSFLKNMNPLKVYDLATGDEIGESPEGTFTMVAYNEAGDKIVVAGLNYLSTKSVVQVWDANTFKKLKDLESEFFIATITPNGGVYTGSTFLALTASRSFNVYDEKSGSSVFTTKSDKWRFSGYPGLGVGSFNVFPLGQGSGKFFLNASGNNINQVYDRESNSIIAYFFSDSNDDFAIVSKDGRVEGTADALGKVFWTTRLTLQRTTLESSVQKGFTPRLFNAMLNEDPSFVAGFDVDKVVSSIPVLAIQSINGKPYTDKSVVASTQKNSTVVVEVRENPKEVTELRLYQNGKLIKMEEGTGATSYTFDLSLSTAFGEDNFFFVNAGSKNGVDAEKAKFTIAYKGATGEKPTLYLVTIGINKYKNPKYNLNYAEADANGVEASIKKSSPGIFKAIVPYPIRNEKALKANILAALDDVKKKSLEQDMLVVYYAGHGVMSGEAASEKEFFIVPSDVVQLYGRDDLLKDKAISASSLKGYAQSINAQKQVFILDACQSAGALEAVTERGVAEEKAIAQLARSTGTFWITSTGSNQFASEFDRLGHGIFTYSLIEGINGKADANNDKKLTIRELSTYIENKVPELSEQLKGTAQYPSAYSFGNDFPLVVYK